MTARTRVDCPHDGRHQHGTVQAYVMDKCGCSPCAEASATDSRRRRRLKAYGRPVKVSALPVARHIATLERAGMGPVAIAAAAGVGHVWLARVKQRPDKTVYRSKALRLLAVTPDVPPTAKVPAIGSVRRAQALAANGWSMAEIARQAGLDRSDVARIVKEGRPCVLRRTHDAIRVAYDEIWDQPPPQNTHFQRAAVTKALQLAEQHGWAKPLEWDDDEIDDPRAKPYRAVRTAA